MNKMAFEVDLDAPLVVQNPEIIPGRISSQKGPNKDPDTAPRPDFDPMRRKLAMNMDKVEP